jgi:hypothetical protein
MHHYATLNTVSLFSKKEKKKKKTLKFIELKTVHEYPGK